MPNHQRKAKAKSGDFVSAIVEHTISGLSKNITITANLAKSGVDCAAVDCAAVDCAAVDCAAVDCESNFVYLSHGRFKKRLAVAAAHQAANTNCANARSMIPASFESVK